MQYMRYSLNELQDAIARYTVSIAHYERQAREAKTPLGVDVAYSQMTRLIDHREALANEYEKFVERN